MQNLLPPEGRNGITDYPDSSKSLEMLLYKGISMYVYCKRFYFPLIPINTLTEN
jgi:hypothetical protein